MTKKKQLNVIVEDMLIIKVGELRTISKECYQQLKSQENLFKYKNPTWIDNRKYGRYNGNTEQFLVTYIMGPGVIKLPRGGQDKLTDHLRSYGIEPIYIDRTLVLEHINFDHNNIELREDQQNMMNEMLRHDVGSYQAYTSFGKTVEILSYIAQIGQPALIIVHTTFLQEQWIQEALDPNLFNIPANDIGGVGGIFSTKKAFSNALGDDVKYPSKEKRKLGKLNICLYHSLTKQKHMDFFKDSVGLVGFDEGQKTPIEGVQGSVNHFRARYRLTMTANFERKDGKQFLTFDAFGPIRYVAEEKNSESKILSDINVIKTGISDDTYDSDPSAIGAYMGLIVRLATNKFRNMLIAKRAVKKIRQKKLVLIFIERKFHAAILMRMLMNFKGEMLVGTATEDDFLTLETKKEIELWTKRFDKNFGADYPMSNAKEKKEYKEDLNDYLDQNVKRKYYCSKKARDIVINYDHEGAYKRIQKLAKTKDIDFIITSSKGEAGLSVRTIDHAIATMPEGKNMERFEQKKGRVERKYKQTEVDYFGKEKDVPTFDILVDNISNCWQGLENIKSVYRKKMRRVDVNKIIKRRN